MLLKVTLVLFIAVFITITISAPNSCSIQYGTYTSNEPFLGDMNATIAIDNKINRTSYIVQWYQNWGDNSGKWSNVLSFLKIALNFTSAGGDNNHMALLTWQPFGPKFTTVPAEFPLTAIAAGNYDSYIDTWVQGIADLSYPVYLRPLHEMDGDWYPWGAVKNNTNTAAKFINAWRHIYSRFNANAKARKNVKFVWCPNNSNRLGTDQTVYYPGDDYVDWIGIDAYSSNSSRFSFKQTITTNSNPADIYGRLTSMTTKPMMIAEFGVKDINQSKGQWFLQLDQDLLSLPRIKAMVYFNSQSYNYSTSADSIVGARAAFGGCLGATFNTTVVSGKFDTNPNDYSYDNSSSSASVICSWLNYLLF